MDQPAYLIVNADDYGYFPCVSRGILAAARQGAVTATGVMANAPSLDQQLDWLKSCPDLDTGVHLNLTWGTPVSRAMRDRLRRSGGRFMSKERMCSAILRRVVTIAEVGAEWQSQIEKCLAAGLKPTFLNSHEHIHMLPPLFSLIHDLAARYGIAHVRYPVGEVPRRWTIGAVARNLIIHCLGRLCRSRRRGTGIPCLGVGESGRLSLDYLRRIVPALEGGRVYEMMCHPGYYAAEEITDRRLLSYHAWEEELAVLTSEETADLLARHGVRRVSYRELPLLDGRLGASGAKAPT